MGCASHPATVAEGATFDNCRGCWQFLGSQGIHSAKPQVSRGDADGSRVEDAFVEYLTEIEVAPGEQPTLYRAFGMPGGLWFERFTGSAWVQDPALPDGLETMGLMRVTATYAGSMVAHITAGQMDAHVGSVVTGDAPRRSERWLRDQVAYGMLDMAIFLTRHAAFAEFCDRRDGVGGGGETLRP
jgi:hypothetical protein